METKRDERFDSLKGFLILSVVFGHFFLYDKSHSFMSESLAIFFYAFHMPLFVFISGYYINVREAIGGADC